MELFEQELGRPFGEVFELVDAKQDLADLKPIAAASIGQVYKAYLKRFAKLTL